ncbi:WRKY domain-containing protein [Heracleum sosnowskyi]|uniref:WRKY domain-containing protein n=1 Tax=Heracleum sosnowskyi TaxID=360622 RepID=A0AAD8GMA8_9APIA|nr:WRKY domain-containing protein [Heracleum sosnowskyi]
MDGRINRFVREQEDNDYSPEDSEDSLPSAMFSDSKMTSTSSPRKSRRALQKRVVSVPIKDVDGSRLKGEVSSPPSDSWAWRKYGQKPIKGSPYPRAYYRCSSSKGCLARKQVERSRADPSMLVVTYSSEHNHSWPALKNNQNRNRNQTKNPNQNVDNNPIPTATTTPVSVSVSSPVTTSNSDDDQISTNFVMDEEFTNFSTFDSEFSWFTNFETISSTVLESPILARDGIRDSDIASIFSTKEEEGSLFADLEELPECSLVFGRGDIGVS